MSDQRDRVLVFDVNETLLDITPLEQIFGNLFNDRRVMRTWFAELVLYSQAMTLAGCYADFGTIGEATLKMVARTRNAVLPDDAGHRLKAAIASLPAHYDVAPSLARLRNAGFRLVTLTNSGAETQRRQLHHAQLSHLFEAQFSVGAVQAFKPAPATYHYVANELGVPISALTLVACHMWDLIGAGAVGCRTGFVCRSGNAKLDLPEAHATFAADTMSALADKIISARATVVE